MKQRFGSSFEKTLVLNYSFYSMLGVGFFWLFVMVGLYFSYIHFDNRPGNSLVLFSLRWAVGFWALSMSNLFILSRLIQGLLSYVALDSKGEGGLEYEKKKIPFFVQTLFWGVAKLGFLGLIGYLFIVNRDIPGWSLFLGLGTLVIVPLVSGLWWSYKEIHYA